MSAESTTAESTPRRWVLPWMWVLTAAAVLTAAGLMLLGAKLAAAGVVVAVAGTLVLARPNAATVIVAFVLYSNAAVVAVRFHGVPRIAAAGVIGLLLVPALYFLVVKRRPFVVAPALPLLALFVALQVIGTALAEHKELAINSTLSTLSEGLILFALVTNVIRDATLLRHVVWAMLIAGGLLGALSGYQQASGKLRDDFGGFAQTSLDEQKIAAGLPVGDARSAGPIGEKNYYAQFMMMLLPLAVMQVKNEAQWIGRAAAIAAAALIAVGVACTASRGAAVAFVVILLAMLLLREIKIRHALLMIAVSVALLLSSPAFQQRLASMSGLLRVASGASDVQSMDKSSQGRLTEVLAATLVFSEHPVLGVGPGNFPPYFLKKAGVLGFQVHTEERLAHCSYLEIAAENGVFGLLCYLGILGVSFHHLIRARRLGTTAQHRNMATAFLLSLIVLATTSAFLSFAFERYYWFVLAVASCSAAVAQQPADSDSDRQAAPEATL